MSFFRKLFGSKGSKNKNDVHDTCNRPQPATETAKVSPANPPQQTEKQTVPYTRLMTSQLVALWLDSKEERFREEYLRRLAMCGLNETASKDMLDFETDIITRHPRKELLSGDFIERPLFSLTRPFLEHPVQFYETHFEYPLSYVVKLSDEAEWHFWYSHEKDLSDDVWGEIFALSDKNKKLFLPFAMNLVDHLGWTPANVNKFSYNEQGMLDRLRWKRGFSAAASNPWQ